MRVGRKELEERSRCQELEMMRTIVQDQISSIFCHFLYLIRFIRFNAHVPRELRNVHEIKKIHLKKNEAKLKNMKKEKRRVVEAKKRKQKADDRKNGILGTKAGNRKVKAILRR